MPQDFDPDEFMSRRRKPAQPKTPTGDFDPDAFMAGRRQPKTAAQPKRPSAEEELIGYDRFRQEKRRRDEAKAEADLLRYDPAGYSEGTPLTPQREAFSRKPFLERKWERTFDQLRAGGLDMSRMTRQALGAGLGVTQAFQGAGPLKVVDFPEWRADDEERMRNIAERERARPPMSLGEEIGAGIIRGVPTAGGAIGLGTLTGGGALGTAAIGGGMSAAGADWSNPRRAVAETALGAVAPVIGGKIGQKVGGAVASRLTSPAAQAASRAGGELIGGGTANVAQAAIMGERSPRELAKQFAVGSSLNVPGAVAAARRPALPQSQLPRVVPLDAEIPIAAPESPAVASGLPGGVRVIRQGEPIPLRERGQRRIPMDIEQPDGTVETVLVVAPERIGGQRVSETMLRPIAQKVLEPQPAAQSEPVTTTGAETAPPAPPDWVRQNVEAIAGPAERSGLADQIEALSAQGLVARQIARQLGVDAEVVRAVRVNRGIPSQDDPAEFQQWLQTRASRPGVSPEPARPPRATAEIPRPAYPDAPETQEMPAIQRRITAENAPTAELPQARPISREFTNRITEGEGAELPRQPSQRLEGQPVELPQQQRRMPSPQRPARPLLRSPQQDVIIPRERREMVGEGRRVGAEIEAGRGEKGEFGRIAQGMFKSASGEVPHGHDAFFHDPAVKGALGLSRDAEMGTVRAELKRELARSMGVNADEVSLTQIGPRIWETWARQKRLPETARAKMRAAIERYQQGVISDIEKAAAAQAAKPSERVRAVPEAQAETGRKIQHSKFGAVTEAADQSGVRKGRLRVIDATGKERIIQNPRTTGNREAAFVKSEEGAGPQIVQRMAKLAYSPTSPVEVAKLRAEFPEMSKEAFDAEMLKLAYDGRIALHRHDYVGSLSEAERNSLVREGDHYFIAATFRERPGTIMGSGLGALQGLFERKAPKAAPKENPTKADIESAGLGKALGDLSRGMGNEMRTLLTSLDFGAVGAQGFWLSASHPFKAINSGAKMFRSLSRAQSDAIDAEIAFHPLRKLWEKSEMYTATSAKLKGDKAGGEEAYRGFLARAPGFRAFERAYRTYLDVLRVSVFEIYAKALQRQGITFENNPKAYKDAAASINIGTGRGQLKKGGTLEKASDLMGAVAFAPRNLIANFQILDPVRYAKMEPAARKLALKDSLTTLGVMMGTAALLRAMGVRVGFNPLEDDFMVARWGNTRYDLTFGKKTAVQFLARSVAGAYRQATGEGNLPGKDPLSVAGRFVEGKASPLISTALTLGRGRTFEGKKLADMSAGEAAWETAPVPILTKDLVDAYRQEGAMGLLKTSPAILGGRVSTYPDRAKPAFIDTPDELRTEQKQFGHTRSFLTPRRAEKPGEVDETPAQFSARKAQADKWTADYGRQLAAHPRYKAAEPAIREAALEYLKRTIADQSGERRPSLYLLRPNHVLATVRQAAREAERKKRREAAAR